MPIVLVIIGIVLLLSGAEGQATELGTLLEKDFTGKNNFGVWVLAIFGVGAVGYIPKMKPLSDAFLALIVVVIFLSNNEKSSGSNGFFAQITSEINGTAGATTNPTTPEQQQADQNLFPLIGFSGAMTQNGVQ